MIGVIVPIDSGVIVHHVSGVITTPPCKFSDSISYKINDSKQNEPDKIIQPYRDFKILSLIDKLRTKIPDIKHRANDESSSDLIRVTIILIYLNCICHSCSDPHDFHNNCQLFKIEIQYHFYPALWFS